MHPKDICLSVSLQKEKIEQLELLCRQLAKACNKIRLHELFLKKRGIGYDGDVHKWAEYVLKAAKKNLKGGD